jgi:hypothetical protein
MIIGLLGYARSGKDTVANILVRNYGYTRVAFADPIREMLLALDPILESGHRLSSIVEGYGWEIAKATPEVRRLLQTLGVGARTVLDKDVWVTKAFSTISNEGKYVITDVRFENEAHMLRTLNGQLWRIKRTGIVAYNRHVSETEMDDYKVDQIFTNNGTIEDLELMVKARMNGLT